MPAENPAPPQIMMAPAQAPVVPPQAAPAGQQQASFVHAGFDSGKFIA